MSIIITDMMLIVITDIILILLLTRVRFPSLCDTVVGTKTARARLFLVWFGVVLLCSLCGCCCCVVVVVSKFLSSSSSFCCLVLEITDYWFKGNVVLI